MTPSDLALHARLGIPPDLLAAGRVRRVDDEEARDLLCVNHRGNLSGIVYPRIDPATGHDVGYRVRRDHPEIEAGEPKNKYLSSADRAHIYFAPGAGALLTDAAVMVVVVESEKACLALTAAAQRAGRRLLVIALGGCWGWRGRIGRTVDERGARVDETGPLPDLARIEWRERQVAIVFDANAATNANVRTARTQLARELTRRGAKVCVPELPTDANANGPDDYLALHGDAPLWTVLDTATLATPVAYKRTDAGNAELFAAKYQDVVRFDHAARIWRIWTGHHWAADRDGAVKQMAKEAVRARLGSAAQIAHDEDRKQEVRWAMQSESRRGLDALLALAESERPLAVTGDEWDRHPMLFPVTNGVIDLETGRLRAGRPEDAITRVAPISYDPDAQCPRWTRFLREIFAKHPEIADYIQRVLGYSLTGLTAEQAIWILFGTGANGKSSLIETLMQCLFGPDLSWTMPFPSSSWSDSMSEYQKAALAGRRFVTSSEVAKQGRLNEELVKSLTGSDTVNARHPYGRPFQFIPQAKFFLRVNDKPQIRDESHGMWRRIKLVPFLETFTVDTTLAATLAAEAPGILRWAVDGCLAWQREGLCEPAVVRAATAEYRDEQDPVSTFIAARCIALEGVSVRASVLFAAYKEWAADNVRSEDRLNQTTFGTRMKAKVPFDDRGRHTIYFGIGLATEDDIREVA